MPDNQPEPEQGTHFWFMTIQAGASQVSRQGTVTPATGATRLDICNELLAYVREQHPAFRNGVVIAFDIQPNKL